MQFTLTCNLLGIIFSVVNEDTLLQMHNLMIFKHKTSIYLYFIKDTDDELGPCPQTSELACSIVHDTMRKIMMSKVRRSKNFLFLVHKKCIYKK